LKSYFHPVKKWVILALLLDCILPLKALANQAESQLKIPIPSGHFNYINGSWSSYVIFDKTNFTYSYMDIAIRNNESCAYIQGCVWMELKVRLMGKPEVVTRLLVERDKDGPGRILKVAVWVEGYQPFWVPESFIEKGNNKVTKFTSIELAMPQDTRIGRFRGKLATLTKFVLRNKEDSITAYLAKEVAPIGIVALESPSMDMYLLDWGMKKESWMPEEPVSFYWWILNEIFKAVEENN